VGEAVKHCASEDATVVIGTVIDPEMGDAIRVTVVATGLGQPAARQQPVMRVVQPVAPQPRVRGGNERAEPLVEAGTTGDVYGGYDQPAWMRKRAVGDQLTEGGDDSRFDLLDVPAFLRRQAD